MNASFLLASLLAASLFAAVPTASACNVFYSGSSCVDLHDGTMELPSTCGGVPCGSPCVLEVCLTSQTVPAKCLFFDLAGHKIYGDVCAYNPVA